MAEREPQSKTVLICPALAVLHDPKDTADDLIVWSRSGRWVFTCPVCRFKWSASGPVVRGLAAGAVVRKL